MSKTQTAAILTHLQRGRTISSMTAFDRFNCVSLHRRLADLRAQGHKVDKGTWVTRKGVKYKVYRLRKAA